MNRSITIYETSFTDVEDGDYVDPDTSSETVSCEPDSPDDDSPVSKAVEILQNQGCTEPSVMPGFRRGLWYSDPDGSFIADYGTGERIERSCHLEGFTALEELAIWKALGGKPAWNER